ncbi:MAG: acetyl/propionyl/methylcrotonyl-CoA carboxylase subunit alpha [Pseudomonadales bacterium]|nr:acetyl/propionyl/methylcrotonyl-CoA carboxylase subunit alpha [Pseudomonadales bacterium]
MSFRKLLIANRGEIACRVIRTAQALGFRTVAVYSEADRHARHVQMADEAVCLGAPQVQQSYLNVEALLKAATCSGAQAIHPGYGFLSENADFARLCLDAGLIFVGPDPHAIELMGSKRLSKIAMLQAGVPCVPGYEGEAQDEATLMAEAQRIGYPLMIKASAGGGGRGMRKVDAEGDLLAALRTARSEALNAFGSGELILERAVVDPRHVEIQIFADRHGHYLYLGERDCSIQRRHQKVVEESPCPVMTPELRQRMGEAAVAAARSCQYVGAGTVEFLLDARGEFYFLEMNTRLQVEHPVTELVTGLDLVELQLRVASGEPLPLTQDEVSLQGHAIEVRFYAEDPSHEFLPQTGPIQRWLPAQGPGIRIDHGLCEGGEVSPFYDPMLAKIIAYGNHRQDACRRLLRAVEDTVLLGVIHNKAFLIDVLSHDAFLAGHTHTGFIQQHLLSAASLQETRASDVEFSLAALIYLHASRPDLLQGWRSQPGLGSPLILGQGDQVQRLMVITRDQQRYDIIIEDRTLSLDVICLDEHRLVFQIGQHRQQRNYARQDDKVYLDCTHGNLVFINQTHLRSQGTEASGTGRILAPMDGSIMTLLVEVGQSVKKGDTLLILEAMKIEHPIKADRDGTVASINVQPATQVKKRQGLISIEASV